MLNKQEYVYLTLKDFVMDIFIATKLVIVSMLLILSIFTSIYANETWRGNENDILSLLAKLSLLPLWLAIIYGSVSILQELS